MSDQNEEQWLDPDFENEEQAQAWLRYMIYHYSQLAEARWEKQQSDRELAGQEQS